MSFGGSTTTIRPRDISAGLGALTIHDRNALTEALLAWREARYSRRVYVLGWHPGRALCEREREALRHMRYLAEVSP
jgi:hypothetical protein